MLTTHFLFKQQITLVLVLAGMCGLHAQTTGSAAASHPVLQLRLGAAAQNTEYALSPGDHLSITVAGWPELSGQQTVGPDGSITVPLAGTVSVANKTREEAAATISDALGKYYTAAKASVLVDKYAALRIALIGAMEHPGEYTFDEHPSLLQVLSRGGVSYTQSKMVTAPLRCTVYSEDGTVVQIDLQDDPTAAFPRMSQYKLRRNDVVFVPTQHDRVVSILGEVKLPGPVVLSDSSTLLTVLSETGGLTERAAKGKIQVLHKGDKQPQVVAFADLMTPRGSELSLRDGDIVYVPKSGLAQAGFVLQQVAPVFSLGTVTAAIAR